MVSKKAIVGLAAIGLLAYAFVSRPKVVATKTQFEPVPVAVPQPVEVAVPFPYLDPIAAQNLLESQFGTLYKQVTKRISNPAIDEYIRKAGGFGPGGNYQKDLATAVNQMGIPRTISTSRFEAI
jgi:protein involved in polysaccharide export with SLBB domain